MWSNSGSVADNLSREFRAMSSERDRRWNMERGKSHSSQDATSFYNRGDRAMSPPLRYGVPQSRTWRRTYEAYEPARRASQNDRLFNGRGGGEVARYPPRTWSRGDGPQQRDGAPPLRRRCGSTRPSVRAATPHDNRDRGRSAGRCRDDKDDADSSSYSYSYSSSSASESEESSTSSGSFEEPHDPCGRAGRSCGPSSHAGRVIGQPPHRIRYTPTGPIGVVCASNREAAVHWVDDGKSNQKINSTNNTTQLPIEACRGASTQQVVTPYDNRAVVMNPTDSQRPVMTSQMPALQPSGLLRRVVEVVAYYRGVPMPPAIPTEVVLAFDGYVMRGSTMLKFVPHGPPHSRYFIIRFLDVFPGGGRHRGPAGSPREAAMPHAVLAWYRTTSSRHMIRFLPLHDLIEVKSDGADHPYVQRRTVQPGMLRGPRHRLSTKYVYADYIFQFHFRSRLTCGEEKLALKTANRTQHLAWLVVGSFLSQTYCSAQSDKSRVLCCSWMIALEDCLTCVSK